MLFRSSFIVFGIILTLRIRKQKQLDHETLESFHQKEREANQVRKKDISQLDYISIPNELFLFHSNSYNFDPQQLETLDDLHSTLLHLKEKPILNLNGISNTELKLHYGTANITSLSDYDQNYILLANTLQNYATLFYKNGFYEEAKTILEFAITTKIDTTLCYEQLATIYLLENNSSGITHLFDVANTLPSFKQTIIVRKLKELCPYID